MKTVIKYIYYLIAASIILAALFVSVARGLTPMLDQHRPDFEKWASDWLQTPVTIQKVRLAWYRYQPQISLDQVTILNKETHQSALQIQKVRIFFSLFNSFLEWQPITSRILISGTDMDVKQSKQGQYIVKGFPAFGGFDTEPLQGEAKVTDVFTWLFKQRQIILRDIDIRYVSAQDEKKLISLRDLSLTNKSASHFMRGHAVLHQAIPVTADLNLQWFGNSLNPADIQAKSYISLTGLSLSQWLEKKSWQGFQIKQGSGDVKVWLDWDHGRFQKIQSLFELDGLQLYSELDKSVHAIDQISANVGWKRDGQDQIMAADNIAIKLPTHPWPITQFYLKLSPDTSGEWMPSILNVGYVNLIDVQSFLFATTALLPAPIQDELKKLTLKGELRKLEMQTRENANHEKVVEIQTLNIADKILSAAVKGRLTFPKQASPIADVTADFSVAEANQLKNIMPVKMLDPKLVTWLDNAFLGGEIQSGKAILRGTLSDFPYDKHNGIFSISGLLKNIDFHFAPDWPLLKGVNGKILFSGRQMEVDLDSATILTIPVTHFKGFVPDLDHPYSAVLSVKGDVKSDLSYGLNLIHASPLKKNIGKILSGVDMKGPMTLNLDLTVPLKYPEKTTVKGDIAMDNATLSLTPWHLALDNLNGSFHFTEKTLEATGLLGELFNKPVTINLSTVKRNNNAALIRANLIGRLHIDDLQNWLKLPFSDFVKGSADVNVDMEFPENAPIAMQIRSDLLGIAVNLPEQFGKKANEKKSFKTDMVLSTPLKITMNYANLNAAMNVEKRADAFHLAGGIDLQADKINVFSQVMTQARIKLTPKPAYWDVNLFSQEAIGQLKIPTSFSSQSQITAQFQKLYLRPGTNKSASTFNLKNLPAIAFDSKNVRINDVRFDQVSFKTSTKQNGLTIKALRFLSHDLDLQATGEWTQSGKNNVTRLEGTAVTNYLSDLLNSMGFNAHNFVSSMGKIQFSLNWRDVPFSPSLSSLLGKASIELGRGRVVDVGAGSGAKMDLGRMLSLFSLQSISRRLTLDFSDLFQKGYSFDFFKGDFNFKNGSAYTENAQFNGPVAKIGIFGRIGLPDKTYDLTLSVVPYVTSSIPLAATLLTGMPVVGVAAFVANTLIGSQVSKVATYYYEVSGPWDNPDVKSVKSIGNR